MTNLCPGITIAKIVCIGLLFSPLWGSWWFKIDWTSGVFAHTIKILSQNISAAVIYALISLFALISFLIVPFIRPSAVRIPVLLVMLVGWFLELFILDINGTVIGQNLLWILWQEQWLARDVAGGYTAEIIRDGAFVAVLAFILCAAPAQKFSVPGHFFLLPLVAGAFVFGVTLHTKGVTQTFPIPFGTFSNTAISLFKSSASGLPMSRNVIINPDIKTGSAVNPVFNKIVVIMDESVRGDYISLNDATHNTTPFLKTTDNLINFGVAISGGNCSMISRLIFRFGMRQADLPDRWRAGLERPTFWQLAQKAGYRTIYIDAVGSPLEYGFSLAEKSLIDLNIRNLGIPSYFRDHELVDKLVQALNSEEPAFIYVEKHGVHFPYSTKYSPDFRVLPIPVGSEALDREVMAAHYQNAIVWSVDEFFRRLMPRIDLSKTLIVYTSDHGQSLLEGGYKQTHCGSTPRVHPGEAYVPLFAITSASEFGRSLANGASLGFDRFSHFEVFPTLLLAMGYDADWVKKSYGPSLIDRPAPVRKFMIGSPGFQPLLIPVDRGSAPSSIELGQAPPSPSSTE